MTDFVSTWNEESFLTTPVAPLGLIAMRGTEDMGDKVNKWLLKWRKYTEETLPGDMSTTPGMGREDFLVRATCPRFGNGEGKGLIKDSVRGLDLYILCDVGAYNCTYNMYGHEVPMSPDDHYMDLKRTIAAVGGKAKRITVIMPLLYGGRQHRRSARESLDCALMLQELNRMGVNNIITFDAHDPARRQRDSRRRIRVRYAQLPDFQGAAEAPQGLEAGQGSFDDCLPRRGCA